MKRILPIRSIEAQGAVLIRHGVSMTGIAMP